MKYQIRSKNQIHCVDKESINLVVAIEHFANHGYEYLYISDKGIIVDFISYHEFIKYGLINKKRSYVVEKRQIESAGIERYISIHNKFSRIVVVEDDEFLYEINLMTEPELLHSIERDLMALRMLPLFSEEIVQQLKYYNVITVLAESYVSSFLKNNLIGINFQFIENLSELTIDEIECVLDYKYGKKLLNKAIGEHRRLELYSLIEKAAMKRLFEYAQNNDLLLKMYKIPDYYQIRDLSDKEKYVVANKIPFLDLINDEDYLEEFCLSEDDKQFVLMRGASKSVRWDSGIDIIQGDCKEFGIEVSNGTRKTSLSMNNEEKATVHFFGPCIVFGMLVINDETIPAYFEKISIENHKELAVKNHGGLNGNNLLNSIMGALATPMKRNDVIIIIDFFNDLPQEECSWVENLSNAFNLSGEKRIRFLDHPVHCNSLVNKIIANYLYKQIIECYEFELVDMTDKHWIYDKELVSLRNFSETHSVAIKTRKNLKQLYNNRFGQAEDSVIGVIIWNDFMEKEKIKSYINEALKKCDILILYYAYEHLGLSEQIISINIVEAYANDERILVQQMSPYFNAHNYGTGHIFGNKLRNISSAEIDLMEAVLIPNHIDIRFLYKNIDNMIINIYRNNGIDIKILYEE